MRKNKTIKINYRFRYYLYWACGATFVFAGLHQLITTSPSTNVRVGGLVAFVGELNLIVSLYIWSVVETKLTQMNEWLEKLTNAQVKVEIIDPPRDENSE